jgi:hypothetical protein
LRRLSSRPLTGKAGRATTVRHVGICTQDGPQEKTDQMRVKFSTFLRAVMATVALDGIECSYQGPLSEAHIGELIFPGRRQTWSFGCQRVMREPRRAKRSLLEWW